MRMPEKSLAEIARVMNSQGGVFVIRYFLLFFSLLYRLLYILSHSEHDCSGSNADTFARQLEVMHAFYAVVWPMEKEAENFCASHYAKYRSREQWMQMMQYVGFTPLEVSILILCIIIVSNIYIYISLKLLGPGASE